jgi:hypothetical protein
LERAGVVLGETYPHRVVTDLQGERQRSIDSTLSMRRKSQHANSDRGYDLIKLPNGQETVVFTKKEYRIDSNGTLMHGKEAQHDEGKKKKKGVGKTKAIKSKRQKATVSSRTA